MKKTIQAVLGGLLLMAGSAMAQDNPQSAPMQVGDETRQWLELQASGNASLGTIRPMPGEIADKVYQRYLDSYDHPLPETFDRDSFTTDSGGGS